MRNAAYLFFLVGILSLFCGILFGLLAGAQYMFPSFLASTLPFYKIRPLHVSFVIWWIFLIGSGGVYYYLTVLAQDSHFSLRREWIESETAKTLAHVHLGLFLLAGLSIVCCYFAGFFGGKEYLEYPPVFSTPILLGWVIFVVNFFRSTGPIDRKWPVFLWMWATGIGLFLFVFLEAHLWLIPYFGGNIVRDITVQWKSYGSLVASWNMLLYGTAMCVMYLISGQREMMHGRLAFSLYFLGLLNAFFNWGHHTYTVPAASWMREVAYLVSMTELVILARLIWVWRKSLESSQKYLYLRSYMSMLLADSWIIANLVLALALSVPVVNMFLHGTHAVVAHSMGTTIGINTMILLASLFLIKQQAQPCGADNCNKGFMGSFVLLHVCLFILFVALISAGIAKGQLIYSEPLLPYREVLQAIQPYLLVFVLAGCGVAVGLVSIILPLFLRFWRLAGNTRGETLQSATAMAVTTTFDK